MSPLWIGLVVLIGGQICYPLLDGDARAILVAAIVGLGFLLSVGHAAKTRGPRTAATLVGVTALGGLAVEAIGAATGFPFGAYAYTDALGPRVLGVPVVVPLAWTWMAWPAWLAAVHLTKVHIGRILIAGWALASWDLFLDPQMVAAGYWQWTGGVIPATNYLGWLGVSLVMMVPLSLRRAAPEPGDGPMLGLYLWTYYSSILAHAVFLGLPRSALWGGLAMGVVAVPLTVHVVRRRP